MNTRKWYVILQQDEFLMDATLAERVVFAAVKSFTGNGKLTCAESYRSISKRAKVSHVWTRRAIDHLIESNWLILDGITTKRGGSCPLLKVVSKLDLNPIESVNSVKSSVNSVESSVNSSNSNNKQSNKITNQISDDSALVDSLPPLLPEDFLKLISSDLLNGRAT